MSHKHGQSNNFARCAITDHDLSAGGEPRNDTKAFRKQMLTHNTPVLQDELGREAYVWILLERRKAMVSVTLEDCWVPVDEKPGLHGFSAHVLCHPYILQVEHREVMSVHDVFQAQQKGEGMLAKIVPEYGRIMQGFQSSDLGPFRQLDLVYKN